jgi:hypothetical protein
MQADELRLTLCWNMYDLTQFLHGWLESSDFIQSLSCDLPQKILSVNIFGHCFEIFWKKGNNY